MWGADLAVAAEHNAANAAMRAIPLRTDGFGLGRGQHPPQALLELNLGFPAEQLPRPRDVRLPDLRVVDRQRLEDDLALRAGQLQHGAGELEQGELAWVAEVDREMLAAAGEQVEAADQIVDVAEAAGLGAVAEDCQRLARGRLPNESWDGAPVVGPHPRPVGIKDTNDTSVDALLVV